MYISLLITPTEKQPQTALTKDIILQNGYKQWKWAAGKRNKTFKM